MNLRTHELSVSELSLIIKNLIEQNCGYVCLRGEISGAKRHSSGHLYFRLKDHEAVIDAVAWRGTMSNWTLTPEDGMEVVCTGRITTYPGGSRYQIIVDTMQMAGQGALLKVLEDRRKKLAAEGLFDESRKLPLPFLPERIGIITSPTGAVIKDMLHRLEDRFPRHVLLWPAAVQGQGAAEQVEAAIKGFQALPDTLKPDLIIIARGGGSLEDLWSFNEEIVVRAIAECSIPTISAIGHETDTTLSDYAASRRAPTPTAAAEMAVPVKVQLALKLQELTARYCVAINNKWLYLGQNLDHAYGRLSRVTHIVEAKMLKLSDWQERLHLIIFSIISHKAHMLSIAKSHLIHPAHHLEFLSHKLDMINRDMDIYFKQTYLNNPTNHLGFLNQLLESLSYKKVLERGFAHVLNSRHQTVSSASSCQTLSHITLHFQDGSCKAQIMPTKKSSSSPKSTPQGTLFND
jgi:exodeoxyribonuclease VII large subunit